ncbi:MAG TPA: histidine kinase dimerization/phospho-acceptor domain-containing protein, partial [Bacillota bacterium]
MNQFTYLTVLIALLALTVVFLSYRWFQARKKLADYLSVLKRIESGTENAKIFVHGKGMIADIGFQTNRIIDVYREQIIELKKSQLSNKQLLTSLSHDVRTPLTSLLGYLDAVTNQVATGIEKEEYIRIARNKAYNLKDFV